MVADIHIHNSPCQDLAAWYLVLWPAQCYLDWAQRKGYQTRPQVPPWVAAGTPSTRYLSRYELKSPTGLLSPVWYPSGEGSVGAGDRSGCGAARSRLGRSALSRHPVVAAEMRLGGLLSCWKYPRGEAWCGEAWCGNALAYRSLCVRVGLL